MWCVGVGVLSITVVFFWQNVKIFVYGKNLGTRQRVFKKITLTNNNKNNNLFKLKADKLLPPHSHYALYMHTQVPSQHRRCTYEY